MGCGSSSGGCSSGGCSSGGCSSMSVQDWLSNVTMPGDPFNIIEVNFKGGRKAFFRNTSNYVFSTGDDVVVDAGSGHYIGTVSLQGELVRLQMKKKKVKDNDDIAVVYRVATDRDLERHQEAKNREMTTMYRAREIIMSLKLKMKLSDVEFQSDNTKATFYYSADDRVDFRALIKSLASEFRIRVEMRQISLRQEAARVGGIGSCGRELCCTTWMTDFKSVSTSAARYQNLSLNPLKLSGQCGRLKCCLNYELETYIEELKDIPKFDKPIKTEDGDAFLQKTDIFKKLMWFGYKGDSNWHVVPVKRVAELLLLNEKGIIPHSLQLDETEEVEEVAVNHDLLQLDKKYRSKDNSSKRKSKSKKKPGQRDGSNKLEAKQKPKGNPQGKQANKPKSKDTSKNSEVKKPSSKRTQRNNKGQQSERGTQSKSLKREGQTTQEQKGKNSQQAKKKVRQDTVKPKPEQKITKEAPKVRQQRNRVKLQRQGVVEGKQNNEKGAKPKTDESDAK